MAVSTSPPYIPSPPSIAPRSDDMRALLVYLANELHNIAIVMENFPRLQMTPLAAPPPVPRDGAIVFADGISWNPGGLGRGPRVFVSGQWQGFGSGSTGGSRQQRLVTGSPITIQPNDSIINVNIASGTPTCTLPGFASRTGAPLTFKDVGGHFATNPLTISPAASETIEGSSAAITLNVNRQGMTFVPANDGAGTTGWAIE